METDAVENLERLVSQPPCNCRGINAVQRFTTALHTMTPTLGQLQMSSDIEIIILETLSRNCTEK